MMNILVLLGCLLCSSGVLFSQILPPVTVRTSTAPGPGALYIAPNSRVANPPFAPSLLIVGNDGKPLASRVLKEYAFDFRVLADGRLGYSIFQSAGTGPRESSSIYVVDTTLTTKDSLQGANGYNLAMHGFLLLPNGNRVVIMQENVTMDMRSVVPGGHPAASVQQMLLQEIDIDGNIIFQWRSLDHFPVTVSYEDLTAPAIRYFHLNAVDVDTDGNFLISARHASLVAKIHRTTGAVLWVLGGKLNQFSFVNAIDPSIPAEFSYQHDIRRLPNGNISLFDNGTQRTPQWSRAVEYQLDEQNKVCRLVWQYRKSPDLYAGVQGAVQTLQNGNRVIAWGSAISNSRTLVTEVNSSGEIVFEAELPSMMYPYKAERHPYPTGVHTADVLIDEILPTNTYVYTRGTDTVGVSVTYHTLISFFYNTTTARRYMWAPENPRFVAQKGSNAQKVRAPHKVYPTRMTITQEGMESHGAEFRFKVDQFRITDPSNTVVYYRPVIGQGNFYPLRTRFNPNTRELVVDTSEVGEFCFGTPLSDIQDTLETPIALSPKGSEIVGQTPTLRASPRGRYTHLKFVCGSDTLVTTDKVTIGRTLPFGTYTWSVRSLLLTPSGDVVAQSESSSIDTFVVAAPYVAIDSPTVTQRWFRDRSYPISWKTNLSGKVRIVLVKDNETIVSDSVLAQARGFLWRVPVTVPTGSGYSIRIRSLGSGSESIGDETRENITIDEETSVEDVRITDVMVAPNPATDIVMIGGSEGLSSVQVFDLTGALVASQTINGTGGIVPVHHLPSGTYTVLLSGPQILQVRTLSIVR